MTDSLKNRHMTLTCYNDTHGWGWKHVDLFVHDAAGRELNWVHWAVPDDGPDAADEVTGHIEPNLERTSEWRYAKSVNGMEYWEAEARWNEE